MTALTPAQVRFIDTVTDRYCDRLHITSAYARREVYHELVLFAVIARPEALYAMHLNPRVVLDILDEFGV